MKKKIAFILVLTMLVSCLVGCGGAGGEDVADGEKGVSIYVESIVSSLDPYGPGAVEYAGWYTWNQVYETLVRIDDNGNTVPCLAKEYSVSEDGLTYSFVLEEGVKFHNGEELKASDAAFSINTAKSRPSVGAWTFMIDKAVATGDYTLDIQLLHPYAAFYSMLQQMPIVNEAYYSTNDNNEFGIGTGPYKYEEGSISLDTTMKCVRYDDYRLGPAEIPSITYKIITDASTASIQFESGEVDFMMCYSVSNYPPLAESGKYNTALVNAPHTAFIAINNEVEPLNNKALRQAMNYATDKETVTLMSYEGLAEPAKALVGANAFGADFSDVIDFSFNIDKAKEKLAEAGFPGGINLGDYGIELVYIPASYHEKIAQCIQETWAQAGIIVELRASETCSADMIAGNYTLCTNGTAYGTDMALTGKVYNSKNIGATNYAKYKNDRVDELFDKGDVITDEAERKAIYKEICEIVVEDCPYVPTQHKQIPYVWNKNLNANIYASNDHPYFVYEWSWNE